MKPTEDNGILHVFDSDPEDNATLHRMRSTPKSGNLGNAFLNFPTTLSSPDETDTVYVVHEVRSSWAGVKRRVLGVFKSRDAAERLAADARLSIERFLKLYNGIHFDDEQCGGTLLHYWNAGNPMVILGFSVEVEESDLFRTTIP